MRVVVFGAGAIGGSIAAALSEAGASVAAIARGEHQSRIAADGLLFRTPDSTRRVRFDCLPNAAAADLCSDDVIILAVKSQHTEAALDALQAAGVTDQPIFCAQNGVGNEAAVAHRFPNVHGMTVMVPATLTEPGEITVFARPQYGRFEIGQHPDGRGAVDAQLTALLKDANFHATTVTDVMAAKYGKLLINLKNIAGAALASKPDQDRIGQLARDEGIAVLNAARIAWRNPGPAGWWVPKLKRVNVVDGVPRDGSSTVQSLQRGSDTLETGHLNGTIVDLGRTWGVPTPVNSTLLSLEPRLLSGELARGGLSVQDLLSEMRAAGLAEAR